MFSYSSGTVTDNNEEFELDEENDDNDAKNNEQDQLNDEVLVDFENDDENGNEEILNSTKSDFNGIKIVDDINSMLKQSYFKIKINEKIKYLHKQSACWLLSNKITKLSSDRLSRVMQQTTNRD
ncbi:unnamed protein product [Rotaria sp. Silwood1]|nr:unnamed protein product [Rotaria sp. Silwood1]